MNSYIRGLLIPFDYVNTDGVPTKIIVLVPRKGFTINYEENYVDMKIKDITIEKLTPFTFLREEIKLYYKNYECCFDYGNKYSEAMTLLTMILLQREHIRDNVTSTSTKSWASGIELALKQKA